MGGGERKEREVTGCESRTKKQAGDGYGRVKCRGGGEVEEEERCRELPKEERRGHPPVYISLSVPFFPHSPPLL